MKTSGLSCFTLLNPLLILRLLESDRRRWLCVVDWQELPRKSLFRHSPGISRENHVKQQSRWRIVRYSIPGYISDVLVPFLPDPNVSCIQLSVKCKNISCQFQLNKLIIMCLLRSSLGRIPIRLLCIYFACADRHEREQTDIHRRVLHNCL
jgi:hypothetical protein